MNNQLQEATLPFGEVVCSVVFLIGPTPYSLKAAIENVYCVSGNKSLTINSVIVDETLILIVSYVIIYSMISLFC